MARAAPASCASNSPTRRTPTFDELEEIFWEEFFKKFDEAGLTLLRQEKTAGGKKKNFNKLIARETAEARENGESYARRHHPHHR